MEDTLITLLEQYGYGVYRQGSFGQDDQYPDTFITFWCQDSPDHAHYDNQQYGTEWRFGVYVYSNDPSTAYSLMAEIRSALKAADWVVPSQGKDVASDEPTHVGRGIEAFYLQTEG